MWAVTISRTIARPSPVPGVASRPGTRKKPVEYLRMILRRDANARIGNDYVHPVAVNRRAEVDFSAGIGVGNGVVQQVVQHAAEAEWIETDNAGCCAHLQ